MVLGKGVRGRYGKVCNGVVDAGVSDRLNWIEMDPGVCAFLGACVCVFLNCELAKR